MTKRYPPEVREKAVRLVLERLDEFESPYAAARAIGPLVDVHYETLRVWVKKALAQGTSPVGRASAGLSAGEREELARLRKEVRDLQQANDILKAASAFFARELDPRHP
ncbi:transposase [Nocardia sp. NPDC004654]|uniref:transposase n=1 Tax=Nocardia sp. NPDC004654 TaxID=3154776 RepID=UPI0033B483A8